MIPPASLQNASGSSPTCYFCALSMCHGKAPTSPVTWVLVCCICSCLQKLSLGCGKERQRALAESRYHDVMGRGNDEEVLWGRKSMLHVSNSSEISLKDFMPQASPAQ